MATVAYSINLVQISPATDSMNLAYIFLMLTLGINFFCFIYVTYIDRQRGITRRQAAAMPKDKPKASLFCFSGKLWLPYLLLVFVRMLFFLLFRY